MAGNNAGKYPTERRPMPEWATFKRQLIYKGQWRHTRVTLALRVVSQQQDLQRLRHHQPEAEAGTNLDLRHMRHPA